MSELRIQNVHPKEYNGVKYRSTLEARIAEILNKLGIPFEYEKRKITLLEGFRCPFQKNKVIAITYTPDFEIGNIMLEAKGFETPEWKNKKKYIYKYLMENEPNVMFYQVHDCGKSLLEVLDNHWTNLGYAIEVTSKPKRKAPSDTMMFDSVSQAMHYLGLEGKSMGRIFNSLTGNTQWVYNYNWKLRKLKL